MDLSIVFLARHGETDWNVEGRWQGQTDVPLNANGRAQARALGARLRESGIASIAASDLSRARDTAELAAALLHRDVERLDPDLRERGFGRFEGLTRAECVARFPVEWARYASDPTSTPPDGETHDALVARMTRAVVRIARELRSPVLVVSHGGAMRALLGKVAGERPPPIANGALLRVIVVDGDVRSVERLASDGSTPTQG